MILNNLKNYLKTMALTGTGAYDSVNGDSVPCPYPMVDISGSDFTYFYVPQATPYMNVNPFSKPNNVVATSISGKSKDYNYLILGTGTTPVTENDYCLENMITSGIALGTNNSVPVRDVRVDSSTSKCVRHVSLSIPVKNTGDTDLTVTEVGLYNTIYHDSSGNSGMKNLLLHREVFEPVIIPSGGTRTFVFDFEFVTQLA